MLASGSVNKLLPIPGVAQNAHGLRGIAEALYLRDHITRQLELAAASTDRADPDTVTLTTGEQVATRSLIWCVGVRPDDLVAQLRLPTSSGRLDIGTTLPVASHPHVFACGDCAAVPDLTRPGTLTGMTAQHAQRQGGLAARNVAASLTGTPLHTYRHRDLGFLVDLGGWPAAADPLQIPLSGAPAKAVTRGCHLLALPGNRTRTATDWAINAVMPPRAVQLGLVGAERVQLECTEQS